MKVVVKKKDNAIPVAITTEYIILLFLANNPGCETAGEICRMRGKKLRPGDRFVCNSQAYQIIPHESE